MAEIADKYKAELVLDAFYEKYDKIEDRDHKVDDKDMAVQLVKRYQYHEIEAEQSLEGKIEKSAGEQPHGAHDFGEVMIHQLIETIEFILGTISNTASYLRLWALSLAHSQLAKVFFDNCLNPGLSSGSVVTMYLGFFIFIGATFGVLMCMDLLECTLHTLRLHWVEFQNKFFKGDRKSVV